MSFDGGCLCGSIRYELLRKYLNAIHCYCGMCRKAHGTAFSTHLMARPEQVRWVQGETLRKAYASSRRGSREFCPNCGTHLLVHGQSGEGTLAIPAGTLDDDVALTIVGHMFTAELVSWHQIFDDLPQHAHWPAGFGPN